VTHSKTFSPPPLVAGIFVGIGLPVYGWGELSAFASFFYERVFLDQTIPALKRALPRMFSGSLTQGKLDDEGKIRYFLIDSMHLVRS
jgi:hypothetical protein